MRSYTEVLDNSAWTRSHWNIFTIISLNYLLDGVMFSIAPLIAGLLAPEHYSLIFAANLLSETVGAIVFGALADRVGRRRMFLISLTIEGISLILFLFTYRNILALAALTSAMTFGIGGEFGSSYSALAELMPKRHRGKAITLSTNFWNIGSAIIAGLALIFKSIYGDPETQLQYLLFSAVSMLIIAGLGRFSLPESPRWLAAKNRVREAELVVSSITGFKENFSVQTDVIEEHSFFITLPRYIFRLIILGVVTIVQYVTYSMMAYYAPYAPGFIFGVESAPLVIFIANLGASIGGILLIPIIDKTRRWTTLLSFLGGTIGAFSLTALHYFSYLDLGGMAVVFFVTLFITLIFSEWAWASLSTLQSELFPTGVRASVVGLLTGLTGISSAMIVLAQPSISAFLFLLTSSMLWLMGFIAALAWYLKGVESADKSVEELAHP
ncbi:MAG: MFS transporter [Nitrososphaerota archaeon]